MAWGETPQTTNPDDMVEIEVNGVTRQVHRNSDDAIAARDYALAKWEAAKKAMETAKADEMEARKEVVRLAFSPDAKEGVNRIPLHNDYALKYQKKLNYKITAPNSAVEDLEDLAPKLGNEAVFLVERIITWTPNFSKSEFNKLDPENNPTHAKVKTEIEKLLTIDEGAPTLAIEAPKGSK